MKSRGRRFAAFAMVLAALVAVIGLAPRAALAAEGDVAKVGGTEHATLEGAYDAAQDGDTIELIRDETLPSRFVLDEDKAVTLNLGEHTLGAQNDVVIEVKDGSLNLVGGVVTSSSNMAAICVRAGADMTTADTELVFADQNHDQINTMVQVQGKLTVNAGTSIDSTEAGITIFDKGAEVVVNDGAVVSGDAYGISGNGTEGWGGTAITINGGTVSATSEDGVGIYHPQTGTITLNGGKVSGSTGIQMCSGTLNVPADSTAVVTGTGADQRGDKGTGDGSIIDGAAISIVFRNYPGGAPAVNVQGGTYVSDKAEAVVDYTWSEGESSEWADAGKQVEISGGEFSSLPAEDLLATGFTPFVNADGSVVVVPEEDIFTVTFVDGEKKATVEVVDGTAVTAQPITDQPGYKVYWALDGKEFDFATPVTGDITLTAAKTLLPPTLTVESDSPAIVGDKATISVAAESDAKVTYTYKWYGNGQLLNETSDTLTASAEGSYYVEVMATDADGQTATAQSNPVYVYFDGQVMYRLYNPYNGEHLYTADTLERDVLDNIGWNYEGIGWIAPVYNADTPVYRLNNPFAPLGDHHYTTSLVEYEACIEAGWEGEGIAWYSADEEAGVPIYRQYNPFASSGTHNYTASENERDTLVDLGWKDEGVAWYALK